MRFLYSYFKDIQSAWEFNGAPACNYAQMQFDKIKIALLLHGTIEIEESNGKITSVESIEKLIEWKKSALVLANTSIE